MEEVLGPEITEINACFARTDWGNRFRAAGQGVVEAQGDHKSECSTISSGLILSKSRTNWTE